MKGKLKMLLKVETFVLSQVQMTKKGHVRNGIGEVP
jgi:hypothetical protein